MIYANGLLLRDKPDAAAQSIRTLYYEEPVVVLETSDDQKWQKVQVEAEDGSEELEGWVAMGNTERTGDDLEPDAPEPSSDASEENNDAGGSDEFDETSAE